MAKKNFTFSGGSSNVFNRVLKASLVSMCDSKLGEVLDRMDEYEMWDDTLLIVWTDHGFLLGEHDCWAKMWMPFYEEVAHTPFFVWDPRSEVKGERRQALVQPAIVRRFQVFVFLWCSATLLHQLYQGRLLVLDATAPLSFGRFTSA